MSSSGSYAVVCAPGALARAGALVLHRGDSANAFIVSSPRVWRHCGRAIAAKCPGRAGRHPILFDDRESRKNLATVESIARQLIKAGADRHATVVAVGGGVVGDVAGFAAATYLRGVRLVQIPTTLVAQVDSAVGGKTGVNLPEGKNLVGAFYPPKVVIADPALLATLPHREYRSGLYEVIKYGAIADPELFAFLERRMSSVLRRDSADLGWIISRSIAIKARVVGEDEREGGLRQILNFGHTLGHALEAATGYRLFLHGEAIGWGMVAASMMALSMDRLPLMDAFRIVRLIASVGPLPKVPAIPAAKLRSILAGDKKSRGGRVLWVFPRKIGKTVWGVEVPWRLVEKTVRSLPEIMNEAQSGAKLPGAKRGKS
ncbi:MAG: 3-dehydroquinate synthase [Candidatus Acidoferrales bacterium]|nr:3-dehydroquinate synthase [Candidatus Acidoferrales bacterium]